MSEEAGPASAHEKSSLKDANRRQLWLIIALNTAVFFAMQHSDAILSLDFKALIGTATSFAPVAVALLVTTLLNGLLSADVKARLVFLRWRHALPGHRAFSEYAPKDPRIDLPALKSACGNVFPIEPREQNALWYKFSKTLTSAPAVRQAHRDFLLTRDYTAFAAMFIIVFAPAAWWCFPSWRIAAIYSALLVVQLIAARQAAATYGISFVTTVLAEKAAASMRGG